MNTRKRIVYAFSIMALVTSTIIYAEGYWHEFDHIQETTVEKVKENCTLVGEVVGHSSYGKITKTTWEDKAKHEALKKADELKATHIVWSDDSTGYGSGRFVAGDAYICSK
jgi:hypothetical protein